MSLQRDKALEILGKLHERLQLIGIYPNMGIYETGLLKIGVQILNELREAANNGYELDAEFENPFYDAVEDEMKKIIWEWHEKWMKEE